MVRVVAAALAAILFAAHALASDRLFVVCKQKRTLQVLNPDSGQLEFEVPVPGAVHEVVVSPDGRSAYVADFDGVKNCVWVIDTGEKKIVRSFDLAPNYKPHGMALTRDGSKLYVTCEASRSIAEVDVATGKTTRTFKLFAEQTHIVTLTPDEKWLYATSPFDGLVSVIDLVKGDLDHSVLSGSGCEGVAVSPDQSEAWLVNRVAQTLTVVDIAKRRRAGSIQCVGNPMRIYFTPDGTQTIVTCAVAGRLVVFDRATRKEAYWIAVGDFPTEIAFAPNGTTVFVTNARANEVAVVDLAAKKVERRFPVGPDPEGIVYFQAGATPADASGR